MNREELLKTEEYWITQIQFDLYAQIEAYMIEKNINRSQLAENLKVSKGYVTQVLNGDFDHRISKLVQLALHINKAPVLTFKSLNKVIYDDQERSKSRSEVFDIKIDFDSDKEFANYLSGKSKSTKYDTIQA